MAFNTSDVISVTQIRDRVHQIAEENLVFRRAFEQLPVPPGTDDNWSVPVDNDVLAEPSEVGEGSRYPTDEESYGKVTFERTKIGQAIPITDEAIMDNAFPIVARLVDKQGRKFREKLDGSAFTELDGNLNASSPGGDDDGTLSYDDVLEGKKILRGDGYNPNLLVVQEDGEEDLLTDSDFTRSTQLGDSVVQDGEIGRASGMEVVVSNTGDLGANDAFIVDTTFYGGEAIWVDVEMEEVEDRLSDTTYLKARTFRDWKALDASAATKVTG